MSGRAAYARQQSLAASLGLAGGLTRLLNEYAALKVQLVVAEVRGQRKATWDLWKRIGKLEDEWISRIAEVSSASKGAAKDEFVNTCAALVRGYGDAVGSYILQEPNSREQLSRASTAHGQFHGALRPSVASTTQNHWKYYTEAVMDHIHGANAFGADSDQSWGFAAQVLVRGHLLGAWLDQIINQP